MSKPIRRNTNPLPALTPDFGQPVPKQGEAVNEALALQNIELLREIRRRNNRVTALEATVKELRKQLRFIQNVQKLTPTEKN